MRLIIAAVFLTVLGLVSTASAADEHVAIFKNVSGKVSVVRGKATMAASPGMQLMSTDAVVTGPASSAGIAFKDGTLLAVGPSAEIEIRKFVFRPEENKYDFALFLRKGSTLYSSGKIARLSPQSINLSTPRASVGVRGTRFIVHND